MIRKCPSLYALLEKKPIPEENTKFLRRSHCGFQGGIPKVCCPTGETGMLDRAAMPGMVKSIYFVQLCLLIL